MRLEVKAIIKGDFVINETISVISPPYDIKITKEDNSYYIIISKKVVDYEKHITRHEVNDGITRFTLTSDDIYSDIIEWFQYIESMGAP